MSVSGGLVSRRQKSSGKIWTVEEDYVPKKYISSFQRFMSSGRVVRTIIGKCVPIVDWLPRYKWSKHFINDLIAGITVGAVLVPQGISYALIANLPPQIGLFSSLVASITYSPFASSRHLSVAPGTLISMIFYESVSSIADPTLEDGTVNPRYLQLALICCLFTGGIQLLMGTLGLGAIVDFVSKPVIAAFTTAGALLIMLSQLKDLLRVPLEKHNGIVGYAKDIVENISDIHSHSTIMAAIAIALLYCLKYKFFLSSQVPKRQPRTTAERITSRFTFLQTRAEITPAEREACQADADAAADLLVADSELRCVPCKVDGLSLIRVDAPAGTSLDVEDDLHMFCATASNGQRVWLSLELELRASRLYKVMALLPAQLIVIVLFTGFTAATKYGEKHAVKTVGTIPTGLPRIAAPSFTGVTSSDLSTLLGASLSMTVLALAESVACVDIYATKFKYSVNMNTELRALGFMNLFGSFAQCYPTSGGFTRTSVSVEAGARSPLAQIIGGLIVMFTCLWLTPLFENLPKPCLGAIVVMAVTGLVKWEEFGYLYRMSMIDFIIHTITFIVTLFAGVLMGIIAGVGMSVLLIFYRVANPSHAVLGVIASLSNEKAGDDGNDLLSKQRRNTNSRPRTRTPSHPNVGNVVAPLAITADGANNNNLLGSQRPSNSQTPRAVSNNALTAVIASRLSRSSLNAHTAPPGARTSDGGVAQRNSMGNQNAAATDKANEQALRIAGRIEEELSAAQLMAQARDQDELQRNPFLRKFHPLVSVQRKGRTRVMLATGMEQHLHANHHPHTQHVVVGRSHSPSAPVTGAPSEKVATAATDDNNNQTPIGETSPRNGPRALQHPQPIHGGESSYTAYLDMRHCRSARPIPGVVVFRFHGDIFFANAQKFKSALEKEVMLARDAARTKWESIVRRVIAKDALYSGALVKEGLAKPRTPEREALYQAELEGWMREGGKLTWSMAVHTVVLDLSSVSSVDSTAGRVLVDVISQLQTRGIVCLACNAKHQTRRDLVNLRVAHLLDTKHFYPSVHAAVAGALHLASKRSDASTMIDSANLGAEDSFEDELIDVLLAQLLLIREAREQEERDQSTQDAAAAFTPTLGDGASSMGGSRVAHDFLVSRSVSLANNDILQRVASSANLQKLMVGSKPAAGSLIDGGAAPAFVEPSNASAVGSVVGGGANTANGGAGAARGGIIGLESLAMIGTGHGVGLVGRSDNLVTLTGSADGPQYTLPALRGAKARRAPGTASNLTVDGYPTSRAPSDHGELAGGGLYREGASSDGDDDEDEYHGNDDLAPPLLEVANYGDANNHAGANADVHARRAERRVINFYPPASGSITGSQIGSASPRQPALELVAAATRSSNLRSDLRAPPQLPGMENFRPPPSLLATMTRPSEAQLNDIPLFTARDDDDEMDGIDASHLAATAAGGVGGGNGAGTGGDDFMQLAQLEFGVSYAHGDYHDGFQDDHDDDDDGDK